MDRVIAQRLAFAVVLAMEKGMHDFMAGWDVPFAYGQETPDPYVRLIPIKDMLEETQRLLDGTSPVVQGRMKLLEQVKDLLLL
jgi:hypothetical protein